MISIITKPYDRVSFPVPVCFFLFVLPGLSMALLFGLFDLFGGLGIRAACENTTTVAILQVVRLQCSVMMCPQTGQLMAWKMPRSMASDIVEIPGTELLGALLIKKQTLIS